MKKVLAIFFLCIILGFMFHVFAQEDALPVNESSLEQFQNTSETALGKIQDLGENRSQWEYFSNEWKNLLLSNSYVAQFDRVLSKSSFLFQIVFGQPYALSLQLFIAIALWFLLFSEFGKILSNYGMFSQAVSWLLVLGFMILFAQFSFFKMLSELLLQLIFSPENRIWRFVIFAVIIIVGVFSYLISRTLARLLKKHKEKADKAQLAEAAQASKPGSYWPREREDDLLFFSKNVSVFSPFPAH